MQVRRAFAWLGAVGAGIGSLAGGVLAWQEAEMPGLALTTDVMALEEKYDKKYDQLAGDLKEAFEKSERRADSMERALLYRDRAARSDELATLQVRMHQDPTNADLRARIRYLEDEIEKIDRHLEELRQ